MSRIGDYSFSPLARYVAPESDGTSGPVTFRPGGTRFPSVAFWRCRYGYAERSMQPQFAEWLAQDFQALEAYRFGLCIRVLDYVYEEPSGGSAEEREAVLAELDALVAAGEVLQLRVCVAQPEYRHYRLQFFRYHTATDVGFWRRLALVYARLASPATAAAAESNAVWCRALLEEVRGFDCPAFTPELIVALVATQASETMETAVESEEARNCDAIEPLAEPVHESVFEIPDGPLRPENDDTPSEALAVQETLVSTVNIVIPEAQIADQRSAASDPVRFPMLKGAVPNLCEVHAPRPMNEEPKARNTSNGAEPESWEISATELHDLSRPYAPGLLVMVAVLILCIAPPPIVCGVMFQSVRESAEPDQTPSRDPPLQRALVHNPWKHTPARGPPEELRIEKCLRSPQTSVHLIWSRPEEAFQSRRCLPSRERQSPTPSPFYPCRSP